jgi:glycosyltransferase involved in cell wall biosynthesis
MKILMLLENEFLRDTRVEKEVQTLFKAGHEIIVAALTFSGLPYEERRGNCIVLRKSISKFINKTSVGALKVPIYFNFWRRYLKEVLEIYKIDAVHIHDLPLCRIGTEVKKKYNIKLVIDLHENWPALLSVSSHTNTIMGRMLSSEKQWRSYEQECASEADRIITVVTEMKERIAKLGISDKKIIVLENTPESQSITEFNFERDKRFFTIIYIGGISFHRGLQYAINGLSVLVRELPVRLWIVGDGKYCSVLRDQVMSLNLQNNVEFFGMVAKEKTDELVKKADLGLIPHIRSEQSDNSSPNKLFDYMAAGLPVLASNCNSVKRVINETNIGMTYIFDSPSDFASVIKRLYNDHEKRVILASNGKKAVTERYNWELGSISLVNLYSGLE